MTIQLVITAEHPTDLVAQIQQLAHATGVTPQAAPSPVVTAPEIAEQMRGKAAEPVVEPKELEKTAKPKKLKPAEQDAAVAEMIEGNVKDERYDLLTKTRKKQVDDAFAKREESEVEEETQDDVVENMFDDNEEDVTEEVTADTVRELMSSLGKDENGDPVQDNLIKIRDILSNHIPDGQDVKVGNIPADKIAAVVDELRKLEA